MKQVRWLAILSLVGGITAVPLLIAFSQTGWGAPGTAAYQTYELLNRLMAIALLLMAAGWVGAWRALAGYGRWAALAALLGTLIFALGTAAEFWLYSDLPYGVPNMRQTTFAITGMATLVQDIGAITAAIHRLPQEELAAIEQQFGGRHEHTRAWKNQRLTEIEATESFSVKQRDDLLRFLHEEAPQHCHDQPRLTHYDLAHNHIYLSQDAGAWQVTGVGLLLLAGGAAGILLRLTAGRPFILRFAVTLLAPPAFFSTFLALDFLIKPVIPDGWPDYAKDEAGIAVTAAVWLVVGLGLLFSRSSERRPSRWY